MPAQQSSAQEEHRKSVAAYVSAGGEETVQRVITAVQSLSRKLDQWYARQLADLDLSAGEWGVMTALVKAKEPLTPTQLADLGNVAPSSMTHRLDKLAERGLIERTPDQSKRTRVFVSLTEEGRQLFTLAIQGSNVVESDVLKDLSRPEVTELARLLEVVIARLDDVDA
ncbi:MULTISPECIES: MarR family transcriptional regulator [Arthrobacter]|uniref:MarR family transcriptional regulator n=2 Tax=Arthrobacter TaxID=1663 RepID=A0ABU9KJC3_9MICC|nr:MarR family transcriptional regulator [Arthrobacter sp. YJM1]MDP5226758.1 MarR family transcriptional regulator [Arthrobacter sp. YJM1]